MGKSALAGQFNSNRFGLSFHRLPSKACPLERLSVGGIPWTPENQRIVGSDLAPAAPTKSLRTGSEEET